LTVFNISKIIVDSTGAMIDNIRPISGTAVNFNESSIRLLKGDAYPIIELFDYAHNNLALNFDCYYDSDWKSSAVGSNFRIYKVSDKLRIGYNSGTSAGSIIDNWNNQGGEDESSAIVVDTNGFIGFKNINPLGVTHSIDSDSTANIYTNVGMITADSGTFVRDSTLYPAMTRADSGTLTDDGELTLCYQAGSFTAFTGFGFIYSTDPENVTIGASRANFSFNNNFVTLSSVSGNVDTYDSDGSVCLLGSSAIDPNSSRLVLKNRMGITAHIGYWVTYWGYTPAY
jgi:hypothetical protein